MNNYCIYQHIAPNGKSYIGQTKDLKEREYLHKSEHSHCTYFRRAIKKYGWDNFQHKILEANLTVEQANEREVFHIMDKGTLSPNGYNLTTGGLNRKVSEDTRLKISIANVGKKQSEETRLKISEAMTGKPKTEEHVNRVAYANTGRKHTEEAKRKMRDAHKGKLKSEEHKRKISEARKGQRPSKESIAKSQATRKLIKERQLAESSRADSIAADYNLLLDFVKNNCGIK